jgi:CheY-like chemotaxis protein
MQSNDKVDPKDPARDNKAVRILVVDDEEQVHYIFKINLKYEGYQLDCVFSGEEALKAVKAKKYDLVFIDKIMPGMDGVETCREVKKASPGSIAIFMTGSFDNESTGKELQFLAAGGKTYYLYKPFVLGELQEVIKNALKDKK